MESAARVIRAARRAASGGALGSGCLEYGAAGICTLEWTRAARQTSTETPLGPVGTRSLGGMSDTGGSDANHAMLNAATPQHIWGSSVLDAARSGACATDSASSTPATESSTS